MQNYLSLYLMIYLSGAVVVSVFIGMFSEHFRPREVQQFFLASPLFWSVFTVLMALLVVLPLGVFALLRALS
jgi:uncharacterized membrane protein YdjX (TVP38/TMEM64 family)